MPATAASQRAPRGVQAPARLAVAALGPAWTVACAAGFLALCWLMRRFVTDDAWITVRYAETLAAGHGFAWNPAGPRVEGFSNPLLVAAEAAARVVGVGAMGTARVLGLLAGVALIVLVHRRGPAVVGRPATAVALPVIALSPALALWTVGGLETMPAALVLTAGVLLLSVPEPSRRGALQAGLAFAVLPWLRPEGIVIALAVAGAAEVPGALRHRHFERLLLAAGPPLLSQLALEALRLGIYGHLLPNPAIYKHLSVVSLIIPLKFWFEAGPLILVAAAGAVMVRGRARLLAVAPVVLGLGSVQAADVINSYSRFFLPVLPVLALLAGAAIVEAARGRRLLAAATTALLILAELIGGPAALRPVRAFANGYAGCHQAARITAAAWLRTRTPPSTVFSISDAGLVPARAGGRTAVDQLMLNEASLQRTGLLRSRKRAKWLYRRRPDVIVLESTSARDLTPRYPTDKAIAADPRFGGYRLAGVAPGGPPPCNYNLFMYARRP